MRNILNALSRIHASRKSLPYRRTVMAGVSGRNEERGEGEGEGEGVEVVEGRASILFPSSNEVFYNPVQEFNRDLSAAVIRCYSELLWSTDRFRKIKKPTSKKDGEGEGVEGEGMEGEGFKNNDGNKDEAKAAAVAMETGSASTRQEPCPQWQPDVPGMRVLEALAASGLRSIRYALEVPRVHSVLANDLSPTAFANIQRNIARNGVGATVTASCRDASMLMYEHRQPYSERFDVIDLDPYGSPTQFLDSTVQAISDGGLLCITCTDMGVLCGKDGESCHSKYGSMSLRAKYCHEMALRVVLASLESHANRYQRYIVPLLSCSVDFYVRVFVRVFTSPAEVKRSPSKLGLVFQCAGCDSFHLQAVGKRVEKGRSKKYPPANGPPVDRRCDQCGWDFKLGGPIWTEAIHDTEFVGRLLESVKARADSYHTSERIIGLLTVIQEELPDVPLYYVLDQLCATLHCICPKMLALRSAILDQGFRVSISHANSKAVKTDAPHNTVWDIMRCWVKQNPVKTPSPSSPAAAILSKEPSISASFDIRKDANPPSRLLKLSRFPENPAPNWGPKTRAKRKHGEDGKGVSKKQRTQTVEGAGHSTGEEDGGPARTCPD